MAAIAATLTVFGYFATRIYAETYLARWGVRVQLVPTTRMETRDVRGAKLVWIETPSNPGLDVCDIQSIAATAHAAGAIVAVDNTTATVLAQTLQALGADLLVASDTKAFNGHSDVVFGHVAASDPELVDSVRQWRTLGGSIPARWKHGWFIVAWRL